LKETIIFLGGGVGISKKVTRGRIASRRDCIPFGQEVARRRVAGRRDRIPFGQEVARRRLANSRVCLGATAGNRGCQLVGMTDLIIRKLNWAGKAWNGHTNKTRPAGRENNRTGGKGGGIGSASIKLTLNLKKQRIMIDIGGRARWAIQGGSVITNLETR
jgi:hypothetical protein